MKVRLGLAAAALGVSSIAGVAAVATAPAAAADGYLVRVCVTVTPKSVSVSANDVVISQSVSQPTTCTQI